MTAAIPTTAATSAFFETRLNVLGGFRTADLFTSGVNSSVRNHFKKMVPQGGVLYKLVEGLGVYASYSKSFRLNNERFTTNAPASTNPDAYTLGAAFPVQEGKGIDFGLKFALFGQKLSGNLTHFDIDYTEIPITSATVLDDRGNFVRFLVAPRLPGARSWNCSTHRRANSN